MTKIVKEYYIENTRELDNALESIKMMFPWVKIEREYIEMNYSRVNLTIEEVFIEHLEVVLAPLV